MFLPWTQNVRSQGFVTTLNPYDRPQGIQSLIDGRIESWLIKEGDFVSMGDTVVVISESKQDYLDPKLLERTSDQINAKKSSASAYQEKAYLLDEQYENTLNNKRIKLQQNDIKINQFLLKIKSDSLELEAAKIKMSNSEKQKNRTQELHDKGIKSLTELENKIFSFQESRAKVNYLQNKLTESRNEIENLQNNTSIIINEFDQKLAKLRAEKMSTLSEKFKADGDASKLETQYSNYDVRSQSYVITSPITGYISETKIQGIGEYIKAGEDIMTIIPSDLKRAVEIFVPARDIALIKKDQDVRIIFDGWPNVVFSGWPENSIGTFAGKVAAIDNQISKDQKGKYRILIIEDSERDPWPKEVLIGGGAESLILLKNVRLYYEVWRQLNGFPPDFYSDDNEQEKIKDKAPIKRLK
jgi:multidrug resistance efflux pump